MNLSKKKRLIARTFNVGIAKVKINSVEDLKEAITRQDMIDLLSRNAIELKEDRGRKTVVKLDRRKGQGNKRKSIQHRKREYKLLTRKLRKYVNNLMVKNKIKLAQYVNLRKRIKNRSFKSLVQMTDYVKETTK